MLESILCLPILLGLVALVVEVARIAALVIVLETATLDVARTLALRWPHVERAGLDRAGSGNAADLAPKLTRALQRDVLGHLAAFPGFHPLVQVVPHGEALGRLFVDRRGDALSVTVHACVPLWFLPGETEEGETDSPLRPADAPSRETPRDCGGRFLNLDHGPAWVLKATAIVELPASVRIFQFGLALPPSVPLVNSPDAQRGLFSLPGAGLIPWNTVFQETPRLAPKARAPKGTKSTTWFFGEPR